MGITALATTGVAANLLERDFAGRVGIADYQLKNNNANMRRIEQRIKELTARAVASEREAIEGEVDGCGRGSY